MATSKEYLSFVLDQLSELEGLAHRKMMGEYILYLHGKIAGGIYDDRLLVKPVPAALALMPKAPRERPYEGAKELLLVEDVDDRDFLCRLFLAMEPELPAPAKKPRGAR
ncbi:MAG: TfoX/Sxy family protein [Oscillospiraceae bacterium]|nr:TfoX/Sxy family protein [Oscillospiraceae bacterium]